jgi:hypothetical protein
MLIRAILGTGMCQRQVVVRLPKTVIRAHRTTTALTEPTRRFFEMLIASTYLPRALISEFKSWRLVADADGPAKELLDAGDGGVDVGVVKTRAHVAVEEEIDDDNGVEVS